jgi:rhodanese-related sulfurtransferase
MNNGKAIVINVLDKEHYNDCHIKGSISVPYEELEKYAQKLDKKQEIIVYCAHYQCPKSRMAYKLLEKLGFINIRAYEGGIREWFQQGLPVNGACKADYIKEPSVKPKEAEAGIKTISASELRKKLG